MMDDYDESLTMLNKVPELPQQGDLWEGLAVDDGNISLMGESVHTLDDIDENAQEDNQKEGT